MFLRSPDASPNKDKTIVHGTEFLPSCVSNHVVEKKRIHQDIPDSLSVAEIFLCGRYLGGLKAADRPGPSLIDTPETPVCAGQLLL